MLPQPPDRIGQGVRISVSQVPGEPPRLSAAQRAALERLLGEGKLASSAQQQIPRRPRPGPAPLSFAQQRLWILDRLEPGLTAYNIARALWLKGLLDARALEQALNEIVQRHEALRTTFNAEKGEPVQVVAPATAVSLPVIDLQSLSPVERESRAREIAVEEAVRSFDLARGPLFRAALLRLSEQEHLLVLIMHHIISDGWSAGVLYRELSTLYAASAAGRPSPLPDLPIQYPDYAVWQRDRLQGEVLEAQLSYWR